MPESKNVNSLPARGFCCEGFEPRITRMGTDVEALRHRDRAHLMFATVASVDDDGDENGGRFEILSPRNP
jgi:hypothetical protein